MRVLRREVLLGALAISFAFTDASAQAPQSPPSAPLGPIDGDPRDAGYQEWHNANLTPVAPAHLIIAGRYEAVIRSPRESERARRRADLNSAIDRCIARFRLRPPQVSELKDRAPWSAFDSIANGPYVSVTIVPTVADPIDCDQSPAEHNALRAEALRFGTEPLADAANDVHAVEVRRSDALITPVLIGRTEVIKVVSYVRPLTPGPIAPDRTHAVRLYLRYEDLAPTGVADSNGIDIRIWNAVDTVPWSVHVSRSILNGLWREHVAWRLERSRAVEPQGLPIALPPARDGSFASARDAYDDGQYVNAALDAFELLHRNVLQSSDRLTATVQVGATLFAIGDRPAASQMIAEALELQPCLGFPETTPGEFRALVDALRPPARCEAKPIAEVLWLGIVPGRAQRALPRAGKRGSNAVTVFTAALALASVAAHYRAQSLHRSYVGEFKYTVQAYDAAESMRAHATRFGAAAYAVWAGALVHAAFAESAYSRTLEEVRSFGARDARAVRIGPTPQGFGLALHFF